MYLSFRPALCKAKTTLCMCNWIPELYAQSFWDHLNSHYSPWLVQAINEYRSEVGHPLCDESYFGNFSIGNIYDFEKTSEKSGIPRIPPQVKADNNMISYRCDAYFETNSSDSSSIVPIENKNFCWKKNTSWELQRMIIICFNLAPFQWFDSQLSTTRRINSCIATWVFAKIRSTLCQ